jgi:hypothetical protein
MQHGALCFVDAFEVFRREATHFSQLLSVELVGRVFVLVISTSKQS